jgi:RES domain-containing protein
VGDATDKSKVPKSRSQEEVVPKDPVDRVVDLKVPRGQSADPKDPEDQEDAEAAYASRPSVTKQSWEEKAEAFALTPAYYPVSSLLDQVSQSVLLLTHAQC